MKIVGLGYPCMDMNVLCPTVPKEEQLVERLEVNLMGGGKFVNAIISAARLGAETAFMGAVGSDRYGQICRRDMEHHGVDISELQVRDGHTAFCLSIVDTEKRGKHYIESPATFKRFVPSDLNREYLKNVDILMLFQMDETAVEAAKIVHEAGGKVVVDGDEPDSRTLENLKYIDVLIASEYFYHALYKNENYETNIMEICQKGPETVVVTLGSKGSVGIENGTFFSEKAYRVEVRDTTGAGDVFHGAFAYCLSEGMSASEAARFSSAVSAVKCTVFGGRTGIPTRKGVEYFMQTGKVLPEDFTQREEEYRKDMWN